MIVAIIITSLIWLIVGLSGIIYLCNEKEQMLDDLYKGIEHSAFTDDVKKRVFKLLENYIDR